jgi:hypothetical protein
MYYDLELVYYGLCFAIPNPARQARNNPENLSLLDSNRSL